jgi:tripeptidyl-peptidase-1
LKPEIAAAFTSGGFSNYFQAPPYMLSTMKKYWAQLGNKNKGYFNPGGRGYPDVSAQSVRYLVYNQKSPSFAYGTSCAAPTFGAIISNINNLRTAKGKARLGFLNPWLYSEGSLAFNDITLGHSRGCAGYDIFTG